MASIFSRNKAKVNPPMDNTNNNLTESYASANGINLYNFVQGLRQIDSNYINNDTLIERMKEDSIISSAIDMWTEDALQRDPQTKEIFHVELDTPDDYIEDELSKGLAKELNRFLKDDLRMEKELIPIIKRLLIYGQCPVKLDFADQLTDDKLELKESEKARFTEISGKLDECFSGVYAFDDIQNRTESLNETLNVDWEENSNNIYNIEKSKMFVKLRESNSKLYSDKVKSLNESEQVKLVEEQLLNYKNMIKGRWFTEIIGSGTNIYELRAKQKTIAYLDRNYTDKFIKPDRMVNFSNNTGKHSTTFEVGDNNMSISNKDYYYLERGESFIENAMTSWQILSALEDILLLTRMTRSILYRIFSVEVGNKGNTETSNLLQRLKNKIKMDETVDVRSKIYNSNLAQVPLGDSIFIPTRNGVGVIDVKTVGGDINLKDAIDLDYFKDKLFAGLRIPAAFLGFTDSLPGSLGDTTLTRLDIRYSRTITRIQSILAEGLKDLCNLYLKFTRTEKALNELPDFKIVFTSINSAEDISRAELKQTQMETLNKVLDGLSNLGVDIAGNSEGYEKTRQQLIKEYFGSVILDKILEDEESMPVQGPTEGNPSELHKSGGPSSGGPSMGRPGGIVSGPGLEDESNEDLGGEETPEVEEPDIGGGDTEEPREIQ